MLQIQGDESEKTRAARDKKEEQQASNRAKLKRRGYQI
jgi:hypothetical protein